MTAHRRQAAFVEMARDVGRIDVDGEQEGPDLVMQIARELAALLLLQGQQLLVEAPVLRRRLAELPGHAIEAVAQRRQLTRQPATETGAVVALGDAAQRRGETVERPQRAADEQPHQQHRRTKKQNQHERAVGKAVPDLQNLIARVGFDDHRAVVAAMERHRYQRRLAGDADEIGEPAGHLAEGWNFDRRRGDRRARAGQEDTQMPIASERGDQRLEVFLGVGGGAEAGEARLDDLARHGGGRAHLGLDRARGVDTGDRRPQSEAEGESAGDQADETEPQRHGPNDVTSRSDTPASLGEIRRIYPSGARLTAAQPGTSKRMPCASGRSRE